MKKTLAILVTTVLLGSSMSLPARAAVKAGAKCAKVGLTSITSGKKFTCVKSGKKFAWSKGEIILKSPIRPTPTPSISQSQSTVPTSTLSPEPISSKTPDITLSFANIQENISIIPKKVWDESQRIIAAGKLSTIFEITYGPKTKFPLDNNLLLSYLENASRLWSQHSQPITTKVFIYNFSDLAWAQQKNRELIGSWFTSEDLAMNCSSDSNCGAFGGTYQGIGQLFIGVPTKFYNDGRTSLGHEFTHAVQYNMFSSQPKVNGYSLLPCWFSEGQPQVSGNTLGYNSVDSYKQSRFMWFRNPAGALGDYSPESILKFYSLAGISKLGQCDSKIRSRIYDVGYMTVEALAAINGLNATMDLVVGVAQGFSFEESFRKIYGISWTDAAPILAKVVSAEFTQ